MNPCEIYLQLDIGNLLALFNIVLKSRDQEGRNDNQIAIYYPSVRDLWPYLCTQQIPHRHGNFVQLSSLELFVKFVNFCWLVYSLLSILPLYFH